MACSTIDTRYDQVFPRLRGGRLLHVSAAISWSRAGPERPAVSRSTVLLGPAGVQGTSGDRKLTHPSRKAIRTA